MDTDALVAEQIAYYRARAAYYDAERAMTLPDVDPGFVAAWEADVARLRTWLAGNAPTGHVLEIAAGSGNWTGELLRTADRVTALDAAPEMLALAREKHGDDRVTYEVTDVFTWEPAERYDAVFMGFWISHVPAARWARFWDTVRRALAPGCSALFLDNSHPDHAAASGPGDWPVAARVRGIEKAVGEERRRTLPDGSSFTMVKRFWHPGELEEDLAHLGWDASCGTTAFAFLHGSATPAG